MEWCEDLGVQVTGLNNNKAVKIVVCRFCNSFGRETKDGNKNKVSSTSAAFLPTSDGTWRTDNIKNHMKEQHPQQWTKYSALLMLSEAERGQIGFDPSKPASSTYQLSRFFRPSLKSLLASQANEPIAVTAKESILRLVEKVLSHRELSQVRDLESDEGDEDDTNVGKDTGESLFPQLAAHAASAEPSTGRCQAVIHKPLSLSFIPKFLAAGLSFNQVAKVLHTVVEEVPSAISHFGRTSRAEVSAMAKTVTIISLDMISDFMSSECFYSISVDMSDDRSNRSLLDIRLQLSSDGRLHNWHVLAVPIRESHTGENMYNTLVDVLTCLDEKWKQKLLAFTSDGGSSMVGSMKGVASRIESDVEKEGKGFIRIWCANHQLDLSYKRSLDLFSAFTDRLNQFIYAARADRRLIAAMNGTKCPKHQHVRWLSYQNCLNWCVMNYNTLRQNFSKREEWPDASFWATMFALERYSRTIAATAASLQGACLTVTEQDRMLTELSSTLKHHVQMRETPDNAVEDDDNVLISEDIFSLGRKAIHKADLLTYITTTNFSLRDLFRDIATEAQNELLQAMAKLYLTSVRSIDSIAVLRDKTNAPSTYDLPPSLPIDFVQLTKGSLFKLLELYESRMKLKYTGKPGTLSVDAYANAVLDDFDTFTTATNAERVKQQVLRECSKGTFEVQWKKLSQILNKKFPHLKSFASAFATIYGSNAPVERDYSLINIMEDGRETTTLLAIEGCLHSKHFKELSESYYERFPHMIPQASGKQ